MQSANYYYLPLDDEQVRYLDRQFLKLFLKEAPAQRVAVSNSLGKTYDYTNHTKNSSSTR